MSKPIVRPDFVTDTHLNYLDNLRESGRTNMFGAGGYLMASFDIDKKQAQKILSYWMQTFTERNKDESR